MRKKQLTFRQRIINNMPLTLLQCLIKNKALDKYVKNVINDFQNTFGGTEDHFIENILCSIQAISFAFVWKYTPEGHDFWKNIHQQYC